MVAFNSLKKLLSADNVLTHFYTSLPIGIAYDVSDVGIGAVLFHRYRDRNEQPISNVSKILMSSQRNYSQIQKEALAIIFVLKKFLQYLFNTQFILITDYKPLLALFGPSKPTPSLAAIPLRLAGWALFLSQFDYVIEYRKTSEHTNADVLSHLPGEDSDFDRQESADDVDIVCQIETLSLQVIPADANSMRKESSKDAVLSEVMRYTREGWPTKLESYDPAERFRKIAKSLSTCHGCA